MNEFRSRKQKWKSFIVSHYFYCTSTGHFLLRCQEFHGHVHWNMCKKVYIINLITKKNMDLKFRLRDNAYAQEKFNIWPLTMLCSASFIFVYFAQQKYKCHVNNEIAKCKVTQNSFCIIYISKFKYELNSR